jgi:hypothetical protein
MKTGKWIISRERLRYCPFLITGTAFISSGKKNEQVLEATLWLAIEKWGRVQLKGDEAFHRKVWDVALRLRAEKRVIVDPLLAASLPRTLSDPALCKQPPKPVYPVVKEAAEDIKSPQKLYQNSPSALRLK